MGFTYEVIDIMVKLSKGTWAERAIDGLMLGYYQRPGAAGPVTCIVVEIPGSPHGGDAPGKPRTFRAVDDHDP